MRILLFSLALAACSAAPAAAPVTAIAEPAAPRSFLVEVVGAGPPMILVPGLGCSGRVWQATVDHYRAHYTVHVVTLAGFGGAAAPAPSAHLLADVRDDLVRYIATRRLERPILVGHSLGAFLAYEVAATVPERVGAVIAVDGVPFLGDYFHPGATAASAAPQAERLRERTRARSGKAFEAETRVYLASQISDPKAADRVAEDSIRSSPPVVAEAMYELLTTDLRPQTGRITAPVLHFIGGAYAEGPDAKQDLVARTEAQLSAIPRHEIVLVPEARHFVMLDAPDVFHTRVDAFLAGAR